MQRRALLALPLFAASLAAALPAFAQAAREITWDELVPADWDPMKQFKDMNWGQLNDADPRAQQMLKKLREVWDQAPVNNKIDNQRIKLPGYVVPLEETSAGLKEFLLVPYFGACIHTPPPPANQIVHITSDKPLPLKSMDVVWATGLIRTLRSDSLMGASAYKMPGATIEPYKPPAAGAAPAR
jgi:hypothetical protein